MGQAFDKLMWMATDGKRMQAIKRTGFNPSSLEEREAAIVKWTMDFHSQFEKTPSSALVKEKFGDVRFQETDESVLYVIDEVVREIGTQQALYAYSEITHYVGPILARMDEENAFEEEVEAAGLVALGKEELQEIQEAMRARLHRIESLSAEGSIQTQIFGNGHDVLAEYQARKSGDSFGVPLPFTEISKHMRGLPYGHLTGILARPGRKKTFVLDMWAGHAAQQGFKSFLYSSEMSPLETRWRVAALMFELPYTKFCDGKLSEEDEERLEKAFKIKKWRNLKENLIVAGPTSVHSVSSIEQQMQDFECKVGFLDNIIGLVTDESTQVGDHVKVRHLFIELKNMAMRNQYAICFTSHQNRSGGKGLDATAYGDAINAYSSFLWGIDGKQEFIDVQCLKAREGATDVGFRYDADLNSCSWKFIKHTKRSSGEDMGEEGIM